MTGLQDDQTPIGQPVEQSGGVLVISPSFFGYERDIVEAFCEEGLEANFLDERPSNSSFMRAALRLRLPGTRRMVDRYFRAAADRLVGTPLRLALIVKGESTPAWFVDRLRAEHPGIRIVYYAYDRIEDGQNCLELIPHCDEAYSFDAADVQARGLSHKPLFHGPAFGEGDPYDQRRWDVSFVGTAHSDRYAYATGVAGAVEHSNLFFYSQARWFFAAQKYLGRLRRVPWDAVSFDKMPKERVAEVFAESRAVVDLQRDGQTGLTMRTFEVLASGARLITTNEAARGLQGVPDDAVLVLPLADLADSAAQIADFLARPVTGPMTDGRYSLREWVRGFIAQSAPSDRAALSAAR